MPKSKPYIGPVEEAISCQMLNSTGMKVQFNGEDLFIGDALRKLTKLLGQWVEQANSVLETSDLANLVAENLAIKKNRRGQASLVVNEQGVLELLINYDQRGSSVKRKRTLPLMKELKERAKKLGVEIPKELGIRRSEILKYLENKAQKPVTENPEKNKSFKLTQTLQKTQKDLENDDPGPMSAGPDEVRYLPLTEDPKPPKKKGFIKTSEAITRPVMVTTELPEPSQKSKVLESQGNSEKTPDLRKLIQDSKEVDIANLLSSDPPKQ